MEFGFPDIGTIKGTPDDMSDYSLYLSVLLDEPVPNKEDFIEKMKEDDDDIVIVGVGGKFPGADNIDDFWRVLRNGENHVIEIPPERWNLEAFYHEDPDEPGKTYVRKAGLLKGYDQFDNKQFGISDIEAARMDPQQRYVLDCVHMALEDGGITKNEIFGSQTGVYIGAMNDDYRITCCDDLTRTSNYTLTGASPSIISARVSYTYNLLGPAMSIDTACSSSLVAIHEAAKGIKCGDCEIAICGGVNCILYPDMSVPLSRARMVSPTGQCQAFSNKADGYARGEGCGILILKTRKQARLDGSKIWASISTGINQDGRTTTPITAPSTLQQMNLLEQIYRTKGIDPRKIQYIEAHGTGTPVGDPKEANTLGKFFAEISDVDDECRPAVPIGSVKTNIGHLESAAGVAGVIKVLLMMKHGKIVPSLHVRSPNPKIDLENYNLEIAQTLADWPCPSDDRFRLSCVNSFGFGGTNSHAIIKQEENKVPLCTEINKNDTVQHIITVSGKDKLSLKRNLLHMQLKVKEAKYHIEDISYTSTCRRDHYQYRVAFQASSCDDIPKLCNDEIRQLDSKKPTTSTKPNIVFVFCGVGTTWPGMCRELIRTEEVFRDTIQRVDQFMSPLTGWSIMEKLIDAFDVSDPLVCHLAIFTCQVALTELWSHYGVKPDAVVGQSVGEVAGAYAAGALTLEEAVKVIYYRSKSLSSATGGAMLVISNCDRSIVEELCQKYNGKVNVAVYSSPFAFTLSGDNDAVDQLMQENVLNNDKVLLRKLKVSCGYHSHHVDNASKLLEKNLNGFNASRQPTACTLISTVTGREAGPDDFSTSRYWKRNVREQVLFGQAIKEATANDNSNIFIEIGPKPVLKFHLSNIIEKQNAVVVASMLEKKELATMRLAVMTLYQNGIEVDWKNVVSTARLTEIPSCQLNPAEPHLFQSNITLLYYAGVKSPHFQHLFVERVGGKKMQFQMNMSPSSTWFLYEHVVSDTIIVPGALYLEVAYEVGKHIFQQGEMVMDISAKYLHPLNLSKGERLSADIIVKKSDDVRTWSLAIYNKKIKVAECQIRSEKPEGRTSIDIDTIRRRCVSMQSASETYGTLQRLGFTYGKDLHILGNALKNDTECLMEIELSEAIMKDTSCTHIHPAVLDGLLQTPAVLNNVIESSKTLLPAGMSSFRLHQKPERRMLAFTSLSCQSDSDFRYNALLMTPDGNIVAEVKDYVINCIEIEPNLDNHFLYEVQWEEIDMFPKKTQQTQPAETTKQKSLLISSSESAETVILSELNLSKVVRIDVKDKNFKQKVTNLLEMKGPDSINSVLFIADAANCSQMNGEQIMQEVFDNSEALLCLCKVLEMQNDTQLPVLIITEKVQSVRNKASTVQNVIGSELWGIARTVVRECPLNLTLIDIHTTLRSSCPVLRDILIFQSPILCNDCCELLITENSLYCNRIVKLQEKLDPYRWNSLTDGDPVHLKSTKPDDIEETFYTLQSEEELESGVQMHVDTAVLHDQNFSPLTLQSADNDVPVWQDDKEDGYDILTYEVCGTVKEESKQIASGKTSINLEEKYVACSALTVQKEVTISKDCLLRIDDKPNYCPGLLTRVAMLLQMKEHLFKGNTMILAEPGEVFAEILQTMLLAVKEGSATIRSIVDLDATPITEVTNLIILQPTDFSKFGNALRQFRDIQLVVATNMTLASHGMRSVQNRYPSVCFKVLNTEQMLSQNTLRKIVPQAVRWLQNNFPKLNDFGGKVPKERIALLPSRNNIEPNARVKVTQNQLFRKNRCYVVVGGLTGLGWEIVQCIAAAGAGKIVTFSRKSPDAQRKSDIAALMAKHMVQVMPLAVDIINKTALEEAFDKIDGKFGKGAVKGIFHGAAVLADGMFTKMTEDMLRRVLLPKVLGTWNLHEVSKRYTLDYFVLHSSITAIFGNTAQSNYGAANAFMDTLAQYRVAKGLPGQVINWGPLPLGLLEHMAVREQLQKHGFICLDEKYIHEYFVKSLMMGRNQMIIGSFVWKDIEEHFVDAIPLRTRKRFRHVIGNGESLMNSNTLRPTGKYDITNCEGLTACVKDIAAQVLQIDEEMIENSSTLSSLGFDSMQAITFTKSIRDLTTYRIPIVRLLNDSTTFSDIVDYLLNLSQTPTDEKEIQDVEELPEDAILDNIQQPELVY
ncbi:uncharacterized protein LOC132552298 [Ylistrum balloti]|uniref:uncharacterized protein LOC132552298 n=1 Tax=Ylistrum balloti TaxID=509963 RepID=UPI002905AEAE|nr:uncharacterized protein LOC132552298 [Ylistrum balloti]